MEMTQPPEPTREKGASGLVDGSTDGRLVCMGGTTEAGVFQVEITSSPLGGEAWVGSVVQVTDEPRRTYSNPCGCLRVYQCTPQATNVARPNWNPSRERPTLCACFARRID